MDRVNQTGKRLSSGASPEGAAANWPIMSANIPDTKSPVALTDQEFRLIRDLVYKRFGINLTEQKRSLIVGRLQKILSNEGFSTFREYYDHVIGDHSGQALLVLVNRISTNYTYFNREKVHFDFFVNQALPAVVAELQRRNSHDLRIWSAGCSSGEEPYMLAMLLLEFFGKEYALWNGGVLATDISEQVLARADGGIYSREHIGKLPQDLVRKYFRPKENDCWQVIDRLRKEVVFRRFNLMSQCFPFRKPFQIVFCRNVMIYFDQQTRNDLVRRFHAFMEPGGYFFIGHSETLGREQTLFKYVMPAVYQRI